jgi:hypothetical protein
MQYNFNPDPVVEMFTVDIWVRSRANCHSRQVNKPAGDPSVTGGSASVNNPGTLPGPQPGVRNLTRRMSRRRRFEGNAVTTRSLPASVKACAMDCMGGVYIFEDLSLSDTCSAPTLRAMPPEV